jgi:hypothetical protein
MAFRLEPVLEQTSLRGLSGTVRSFERDEQTARLLACADEIVQLPVGAA